MLRPGLLMFYFLKVEATKCLEKEFRATDTWQQLLENSVASKGRACCTIAGT